MSSAGSVGYHYWIHPILRHDTIVWGQQGGNKGATRGQQGYQGVVAVRHSQ